MRPTDGVPSTEKEEVRSETFKDKRNTPQYLFSEQAWVS